MPFVPEAARPGWRLPVQTLADRQLDEVRLEAQADLDGRRALGTSVTTTWARYKTVSVKGRVVVGRQEDLEAVRRRIHDRLHQTISPLPAPGTADGWAFGEPLRASNVYRVLEQAEPGVRYVEDVRFVVDEAPDRDIRSVTADGYPARHLVRRRFRDGLPLHQRRRGLGADSPVPRGDRASGAARAGQRPPRRRGPARRGRGDHLAGRGRFGALRVRRSRRDLAQARRAGRAGAGSRLDRPRGVGLAAAGHRCRPLRAVAAGRRGAAADHRGRQGPRPRLLLGEGVRLRARRVGGGAGFTGPATASTFRPAAVVRTRSCTSV